MEFIKKVYKNKVVSNIILLIFGLLLLIFPVESISIVTKIIASILILIGIINIIYFFVDKDLKTRMDTLYFILSLIGIGVGIYTFIKPLWLVTTLNIIVGLILILTALFNIKYLFKYITKNTLWWVFMVISALILVLGLVAIINPVEVASFITRLEGLSLLFDAIMSLLILKKYNNLLIEPPKEDN